MCVPFKNVMLKELYEYYIIQYHCYLCSSANSDLVVARPVSND
jgi:hypothetical protein